MKVVETLAASFGLVAMAHAHMEMKYPPPFKSKFNTNSAGDIDYSMTSPLDASGDNFPCKGYNKLMGTPKGASVDNWTPGQDYNMTITGGTPHGGGSCQASVSFDKGSTFKVIHSYIGNCPVMGDSSYKFTLPSDTPSGEMLFAWTWFNNIGNREMYMNCAVITVKGAGKKRSRIDARGADVPLSKRPAMFVANVGNGFCTYSDTDLEFPEPGSSVDNNSKKTAPPGKSNTCGGSPPAGGSTGNAGDAGGGSGSGSGGGAASQPAQPAAPSSSTSAAPAAAPPATSSAPAAAPTSNPPAGGGVFVTVATSSSSAAAVPTSATTSAAQGSSTSAAAAAPAQPTSNAPSASAPATAPGGGNTGGSGSTTAGTKCEPEGQWNCLEGTQFQRCAAGVWSAPMAVAAGTKCIPGKSDNLAMAA